MTNLHTQARDEADRLRAAGDDGAADLVDTLRKENERMRDHLERTVLHLEALIEEAGRNIEWGEEDPFRMGEWFEPGDLQDIAEARAALTPHGAVTPETKG